MMQSTTFVLHVRICYLHIQYPTSQVSLMVKYFDFTASYHSVDVSYGSLNWLHTLIFWNNWLNFSCIFKAVLKMWKIKLPVCVFSIFYTKQNQGFYFLVSFFYSDGSLHARNSTAKMACFSVLCRKEMSEAMNSHVHTWQDTVFILYLGGLTSLQAPWGSIPV